MNLGDLAGSIPFVGQLLPILRLLGIQPEKFANALSRDEVARRLEQVVPQTVSELEADGLTPAAKAASPEGERIFIRTALFESLRLALKHILPGGKFAGRISDIIRDQHDDRVVEIVSAQMDPATTTEQAVRMVNAAFIDRAF